MCNALSFYTVSSTSYLYNHIGSVCVMYTVFAAPPFVSAQAAGPYSINVTWKATEEGTTGVIHYEIQWSLSAADNMDNINTRSVTIPQEGNASSVLIRDLLPSMEYSIQVRVFTNNGLGQWSHQVRAQTDPAGT